jgi:hypothetical protein
VGQVAPAQAVVAPVTAAEITQTLAWKHHRLDAAFLNQ